MTSVQKPKPASTLILLRPARPSGFEVYLTRRPRAMAFLGGMYVFPGGNVRADDCSETILERCDGVSHAAARRTLGADLNPRVALGYWVAAVRELYEETGILLASRPGGASLTDAELVRLQPRREALLARKETFSKVLSEWELRLDLGRVLYFSRWQTPREFSTRFDTRFFVAPLPSGQTPVPDPAEVADGLWLTPDEALSRFNREELPMIFPTFASLRTLADFETMESVLEEFRRRASDGGNSEAGKTGLAGQ